MRVLIAGLSLLLFQSQQIEQLVEDLAQANAERRESAAKQLLLIGEPARIALHNAMQSQDVELRARAKVLLEQLDQIKVRNQCVGETWIVSIPKGTYSVQELAEKVQATIPIRLDIQREFASDRIQWDSGSLSFLKFLDRLCEIHGRITLSNVRRDRVFRIVGGAPLKEAPVLYTGPFRVWIERLRVETRDPFDSPWHGLSLLMGIAWQPNVRVIHGCFSQTDYGFKLTEVVAEDGEVVRQSEVPSRLFNSFTSAPEQEGLHCQLVTFGVPKVSVHKLSRIKGVVKLALPQRIEELRFNDPLAEDKTIVVGNVSIGSKECHATKTGTALRVRVSLAKAGDDAGNHDIRLGVQQRIIPELIRLIAADGVPYKFNVETTSHFGPPSSQAFEVAGEFPYAGRVSAVVVPVIADFVDYDVDVEFKNVALP